MWCSRNSVPLVIVHLGRCAACRTHFDCFGVSVLTVHKWITDARHNAFKGMAKVCWDGGLEDEDMPHWTRKVIGEIVGPSA